MDIRFGDETYYLSNGINLFNKNITSDWGPVYSVWYYLLSLLVTDPVNLYYFNFILMTILPSIALYLLLSKLNKIHFLNFILSFFFLVGSFNLPVWPKVSSFGLIFIFVGLILLIKSSPKGFNIVTAYFLIVILTYIRPEYFLLLLPLLLIIIKGYKKIYSLKVIGFTILTTVLILIIVGVPFSSDRSYVAFGQAFEKYLPLTERIDENGAKGYEQIMQENFGNSNSIFEAFKYNFKKASQHIFINLSRFPNLLLTLIDVMFPSVYFGIKIWQKIIILLSLLVVWVIVLLYRLKIGNPINIERTQFSILFFSLYLTIPSIISLNLFFPRKHYLILLLPALYVLIGYALNFIKNNWIYKFSYIYLITSVIAAFYLVPDCSNYYKEKNFFNRESIYYLRSLNISSQVNLLENKGWITTYLPNNYNLIDLRNNTQSFINVLNEKKINMIYLTSELNSLFEIKKDSSWSYFLNNFSYYGFVEKKCEDKRTLIKKNILK
jgi:hypothetical protein